MEPLHPTDPPRIGDYRLLSRLGSGGMGQVYLARTPAGRNLVVKVIRPEFAAEAGFRARFAREAEAARRVGGFHTAQVVDADPEADTPWIATAYITGPTLGRTVRERGPLAPSALRVLATGLAEGLKAIHACGLVHRDLKPANIVLAEDGPRIIDFGIARPLDGDSMTTQGAVFGTLPYMSPEQTDSSRVGPASDVFSLGTVLAYAATGVSPFSGSTMAETLRRLIGPPPDPGDIDPGIRELIRDCWDHDPEQRPTPGQILARFEEHDLEVSWPPPAGSDLPVPEQPPAAPATPPTLKEGAGLKRKTPLLIAGAGTAAVVLIGGLILWNPLGFALPLITEPVVLAEAWAAESVAFSPDGRTLAAGGLSGDIRLWDVRTGEHILSMSGYESGVDSLAFHPDGTTLASSSFGTETDPVRLWDVATGEWERSLSVEGWEDSDMPTNDVAFHPTGNLIVTAQATGAHLWDSEAAEPIAGFTAEEEEGLSISPRSSAFSPDGALLATGTNDNMVLLWEVDTTELVATLTGHTNPVTAVAFSPDGSTLASGGDEESARLWDVRTGNQSAVLETASSRSLSFHPDGSLLATGGFREAQVWNIETGERVAISDSADFTGEVAFSPDGSGLATADSGVYLWPMD